METLQNFKRTDHCGVFRPEDIGRQVSVCGWCGKIRDLGQLIFIDLRDRTGVFQLAFDDNTPRELFQKAFSVRSEYVLAAKGVVRERASKNMDLPTGQVELEVTELRILAQSETPPFEIVPNCDTAEATRLKYRYLDLRRPDLQKKLLFRHRAAKLTRDYFDEQGFVELETPILIKSTPEGARDYLVPSRLHPHSFYALPQSPQLYKQLSMVAGFDRYFQIARCFRDEDLRADRQPEFTQIDLEMSFVDMEDILSVAEGYMVRIFKELLDITLPSPFPRLTYREAMDRFGTDKPDTRFGCELFDLTDTVKDCGFTVFSSAAASGGSVWGFVAKGAADKLSRKELDRLSDFVKGIGGKGLAWIRLTEDKIASSFSKFMTETGMADIIRAAQAELGDAVLIIADSETGNVLSQLGLLRTETAKKLSLIRKEEFSPLWIVEYPYFDFDPEQDRYVPMHHAFTAPMDECLPYLETDKEAVRAKAYDLVLNGVELASGSIRITDPDLQKRIFGLLGLTEEESRKKFGFLMEAFKYGAPPHGGMGIGLDRLVMQMTSSESLRDVVAFPKLQNASEPMTNCPDTVDPVQLDELGLCLKDPQA